MKIKMLDKRVLVNYSNAYAFHKGRTYNATPATNLPNHIENQLYFVEKEVRLKQSIYPFIIYFRHSMLISLKDGDGILV